MYNLHTIRLPINDKRSTSATCHLLGYGPVGIVGGSRDLLRRKWNKVGSRCEETKGVGPCGGGRPGALSGASVVPSLLQPVDPEQSPVLLVELLPHENIAGTVRSGVEAVGDDPTDAEQVSEVGLADEVS